jgi:hypothetical protein
LKPITTSLRRHLHEALDWGYENED